MTKALALAQILHSELAVEPVVKLARGQSLEAVTRATRPLLLIANPHGLHAALLLEAQRLGIASVIVEKPAVVTLEQADSLKKCDPGIAVCHGYRRMWGPQTLASLYRGGELGTLVAIEGRYWQSSAAVRLREGGKRDSWKNDSALSGPFDTLVDLGAHWVDLAVFCAGSLPDRVRVGLSHAGAEAPHRDTHVQLGLEWKSGPRAMASISKIWHGSSNHLEIHLLGTKGRASWDFGMPDAVTVAHGAQSTQIPREANQAVPSGQAPFHALGWLEGYLGIVESVLLRMNGLAAAPVPTLGEHLGVMRLLFQAASAQND